MLPATTLQARRLRRARLAHAFARARLARVGWIWWVADRPLSQSEREVERQSPHIHTSTSHSIEQKTCAFVTIFLELIRVDIFMVKSHFVPQFYLKNFSIAGKPERVYVYRRDNKDPVDTRVRRIAAIKGFYSVTLVKTGET